MTEPAWYFWIDGDEKTHQYFIRVGQQAPLATIAVSPPMASEEIARAAAQKYFDERFAHLGKGP